MRRESHNTPGGTMIYAVWTWSTVPAHGMTASITSRGKAIRRPSFTLCPVAHRTTCSIGSLPANTTIELLIKAKIRTTATSGAQVTVTVTVAGQGESPAEATITTQVGGTIPVPTSLPPIPPVTFPVLPGTTVSPPGSLSTIFPVVTPSPTDSPRSHHRAANVAAASSTLPIDPRLIGGQLAGLAVLAAAVTMAIARLSLRTASPATAPGQAPPAQPPHDAGTPAS